MKEKETKDLADPIKDIKAFEYIIVSDGYNGAEMENQMFPEDEKED